MKREEREKMLAHEHYLLLLPQGTREQDIPKSRLLIATPTIPDQACGKAHRVGTIRVHDTTFPLYRLRITVANQRSQVMLPNLFILVDDGFVDYTRWSVTNTN